MYHTKIVCKGFQHQNIFCLFALGNVYSMSLFCALLSSRLKCLSNFKVYQKFHTFFKIETFLPVYDKHIVMSTYISKKYNIICKQLALDGYF